MQLQPDTPSLAPNGNSTCYEQRDAQQGPHADRSRITPKQAEVIYHGCDRELPDQRNRNTCHHSEARDRDNYSCDDEDPQHPSRQAEWRRLPYS